MIFHRTGTPSPSWWRGQARGSFGSFEEEDRGREGGGGGTGASCILDPELDGNWMRIGWIVEDGWGWMPWDSIGLQDET